MKNLSGKELTYAEMNLRSQVNAYVETFRHYLDDCSEIRVDTLGPQIGIREARRVIGKETLLGDDIVRGIKRNDSIGRAAWSPEIHISDTELQYIHISDNDYASIPFGIIDVKDCSNLWAAGRLVSTDSKGMSSVRVMGTSFATGQAAGVSAGVSAQKVSNYSIVREELLRQGALL